MKRVALLMLAASVVAGCAPQGPLGTVGAILTAPITAPVMFVSARMNDRDALPAVDARSKAKAGETLEQALERGMVDQGLYWQNRADASGYAAGGATVLATGRTDDDRVCHEVLIETAMESRATDQRVATYGPGQLAAQRSATTTATGRINPVSWRRAQPFRWNPVSPATRDTGPRTVVN